MPETLKDRNLTIYEWMILPYKKELEEKELLMKAAQDEARQERERALQEREQSRQKNLELIKLGLQLDLSMERMIQMTGLTAKEITQIINRIKNKKD
ncbi:MAG: hypothetical protein AAGI38_12140 [Bacteroidota bacterium]